MFALGHPKAIAFDRDWCSFPAHRHHVVTAMC